MQSATGALARHIVATDFGDLPTEVVREAKRRIADVVAAGLSGSTTPVGARIKKFAQKNAHAGTADDLKLSSCCNDLRRDGCG